MPPLNLGDGQNIRSLIVEPVVEGLRAQILQTIQPMVTRIEELEAGQKALDAQTRQLDGRVNGLERYKAKVAMVCSGIAIVAGILWRVVQDRIMKLLTRR